MPKLTDKQQRFCDEYLIDANATQAAIKAGYSKDTAWVSGSRLLRTKHVADYIAQKVRETSEELGITRAMVVRRWWELANVDVNEIVEARRENCRHCWGVDHAYQWSAMEYARAFDEAIENGKPPPNGLGGLDWMPTREPNHECPECGGAGIARAHIHDSRDLVGAARRLYNGVQITRDGLKVLLLDRDKALENVARFLGMDSSKLELSGPNGTPLQTTVIDATKLTDDQLAAIVSKTVDP